MKENFTVDYCKDEPQGGRLTEATVGIIIQWQTRWEEVDRDFHCAGITC